MPGRWIQLLRFVLILLVGGTFSCTGPSKPEHNEAAFLKRVALLEVSKLDAPAGVLASVWETLKNELARIVTATEIEFAAPDNPQSKVVDIQATENNGLVLAWAYTNSGDYDQNGEVNASDLTPMGPALLKTDNDTLWLRWQLADGDSNGEVNISDITPIGGNFRSSIDSYQVQHSSSPDGQFSPVAEVELDSSTIPTGQFRKRFVFQSATAASGWYRVVPKFQSEVGIPSLAVAYQANTAPVASFVTNVQLGQVPLDVQFDASASNDFDGTIVLYEWDFDGDGIIDSSGPSENVQHTYDAVGHWEPSLRITDNQGLQDQMSACQGALNWTYTKFAEMGNHDTQGCGIPGALPICPYTEYEEVDVNFTRLHLWFANATSAMPSDPTEWQKYEAFPSVNSVAGGNPVTIQGKPWMLLHEAEPFPSATNYWRLAAGSSAAPASAAEWQVSDLITYQSFSWIAPMLFELNGRPALVMLRSDTAQVEFWAAKVDLPASTADWDISVVEVISDPFSIYGHFPVGSVRQGRPVVAYAAYWSTELHYSFAGVDHPVSESDWTVCTVDPLFAFEIWLEICDGEPVLIYKESGGPFKAATALTAEPTTPGHWATYTLDDIVWLDGVTKFGELPLILGRRAFGGEYWFQLGCGPAPRSYSEWIGGSFDRPLQAGQDSFNHFFVETPGGIACSFANKDQVTNERALWYGFCPNP